MTEINFQPIFDYFDDSFKPIIERMDRLEERMSDLETAIANLSAQV